MDDKTKKEMLRKAQDWWREEVAKSHVKNTLKLVKANKFKINPFTWSYLAYFFEGKQTPMTVARVLVYPRILGTSISTTFGRESQSFVTKVFEGVSGSTTSGIDLEFIDKKDGRKKYAQVKAGPNTINADDVDPIMEKFKSAIRLARTNNLHLANVDFLLCLLYGEPNQMSAHMKKIQRDFPVIIGADFWERFTGDKDFYSDLITSIGEVAAEFDMKDRIDEVVSQLAKDIEKNYPEMF